MADPIARFVMAALVLLGSGQVRADDLPKLPDLIAQGFQIRTGLGATSVLVQKDKQVFICGLQSTALSGETAFRSACYPVR